MVEMYDGKRNEMMSEVLTEFIATCNIQERFEDIWFGRLATKGKYPPTSHTNVNFPYIFSP
jgi:hypothetical protein